MVTSTWQVVHFILSRTPAQLQVSSVVVCIFATHNPISLHTANGSIVTVEVGSVKVEVGAGFTYATGENATTLWPGWVYLQNSCTLLLHFCIHYVLFPSLHPLPNPLLHNISILHLLSSSPSSTAPSPSLYNSLYLAFLTFTSTHVYSTVPSYLPLSLPFLCSPSIFITLDGLPPRITRINTIAIPLTVIYYILTTAAILFGVVCIVFNFVYRKRK